MARHSFRDALGRFARAVITDLTTPDEPRGRSADSEDNSGGDSEQYDEPTREPEEDLPEETDGVRADFPDWWGKAEFDYWNTAPNTYRDIFDSDEDYQRGIEVFDKLMSKPGRGPISKEQADAYRNEFMQLSALASWDWGSYRAYLEAVGSAGIGTAA